MGQSKAEGLSPGGIGCNADVSQPARVLYVQNQWSVCTYHSLKHLGQ